MLRGSESGASPHGAESVRTILIARVGGNAQVGRFSLFRHQAARLEAGIVREEVITVAELWAPIFLQRDGTPPGDLIRVDATRSSPAHERATRLPLLPCTRF